MGQLDWNSSMRLPAGSASRTWRPPGPATTSLRNDSPAPRSRSISASRSSTIRWMRLRPAVAGVVGGGAGAGAGRPGQQQPQRAADHVGEGGRGAGVHGEAEVGGVEVDGGLHVVDEVADAGVLVGCGHGWTSVTGGRRRGRAAGGGRGCRCRPRCAGRRGSRPVAVAGRGGVGDAPVHPPGMARELGADLAGLVAQGDHVVEPAAGQRVQVPGALAGDVDAVLVAQHPYGVGVQVGLGAAAGAGHLDPTGGAVAEQGLGDR